MARLPLNTLPAFRMVGELAQPARGRRQAARDAQRGEPADTRPRGAARLRSLRAARAQGRAQRGRCRAPAQRPGRARPARRRHAIRGGNRERRRRNGCVSRCCPRSRSAGCCREWCAGARSTPKLSLETTPRATARSTWEPRRLPCGAALGQGPVARPRALPALFDWPMPTIVVGSPAAAQRLRRAKADALAGEASAGRERAVGAVVRRGRGAHAGDARSRSSTTTGCCSRPPSRTWAWPWSREILAADVLG